MSRKIKNIIMIILIIVLCISMYFTLNSQKSRFGNRENMPSEMENGNFGKNRPDNMNEIGEIPEMSNDTDVENMVGEPPAKPQENGNEIISNDIKGNMRQGQGRPDNMDKNMMQQGKKGDFINILVAVESFGIMALSVYLIMSKFNKLTLKETLNDKNQIIIYILLVVLLTAIVTLFVMFLNKNNNNVKMNDNRDKMMMPNDMQEVSVEKETKAEDVDPGETVTGEKIDLGEYSSNITIKEAGIYTLYGECGNSVLVDAPGEVTLNLQNVIIKNDTNAAIANISSNPLIINLPKDSQNIVADGGSSEYDACIYSAGPLTIKGSGKLEIYGTQKDGEGIATKSNNITIDGGIIKIESEDDGINAGGDGGTITINAGEIHIIANGDGIDSNKDIVINGGTVYTLGSPEGGDSGLDADKGIAINGGEIIALGSDMLEKPLESSTQKSVIFNLNITIKEGSQLIVKNRNREEVVSFTADGDFKNLIISNENIDSEDEYYLYYNNENIAEGIL